MGPHQSLLNFSQCPVYRVVQMQCCKVLCTVHVYALPIYFIESLRSLVNVLLTTWCAALTLMDSAAGLKYTMTRHLSVQL